jgi:pSer/pThr/pTyr-binding forkhead associated (FHA) protein
VSIELVELEPLPGRRVAIDAELTIGRQGCDLTVSSPQVSRRHATVAPSGEGAEITDLGSRNGTFVNDERLAESRPLRAGDTVRVGETIWEVAAVQGTSIDPGTAARGDVPAPPPPPAPVAPPPAPVAAAAPVAEPATASLDAESHPRPSAARRMEATLICYAVVTLTAIGVVGYLATR